MTSLRTNCNLNNSAALGSLSLAGTPAATPLGYYSWTFGQAARDPYYILVIIYIFYPYFSSVVVGDPIRGQSLIGYLNATGGVLLALTAPFLGAIADKNGRRKPWVVGTVLVMSVGAMLLWWVKPEGAGMTVTETLGVLLVVNFAFAISEVFHNAMLPSIAPMSKIGTISGIAFALGNVGGLSLMLFVLFAFAMPGTNDWSFLPSAPLFGLDRAAHEHDRIVGPIAALWMIIFTLPLLLFTPDGRTSGVPLVRAARQGILDVLDTARHLRHYANIAIYLGSRMLFIDGMIGVLTFGGVYASGHFGWGSTPLLILGLCTSGSAMIGAWIGGILDDRLGSLGALKIAIGMSSLVLIVLVSVEADKVLFFIKVSTAPAWNFPYFRTISELIYLGTYQVFALFFVTGLSSSRTLMARITPPEMATQFFGLFALSSTATAFLAPLMVATMTSAFQSQRAGFASLAILMVLGFFALRWVREERATVAGAHQEPA